MDFMNFIAESFYFCLTNFRQFGAEKIVLQPTDYRDASGEASRDKESQQSSLQ